MRQAFNTASYFYFWFKAEEARAVVEVHID